LSNQSDDDKIKFEQVNKAIIEVTEEELLLRRHAFITEKGAYTNLLSERGSKIIDGVDITAGLKDMIAKYDKLIDKVNEAMNKIKQKKKIK
jgi:hypothetical protein